MRRRLTMKMDKYSRFYKFQAALYIAHEKDWSDSVHTLTD